MMDKAREAKQATKPVAVWDVTWPQMSSSMVMSHYLVTCQKECYRISGGQDTVRKC